MSKVTQFLTVCGVLAVAGCSASDADLSTAFKHDTNGGEALVVFAN